MVLWQMEPTPQFIVVVKKNEKFPATASAVLNIKFIDGAQDSSKSNESDFI